MPRAWLASLSWAFRCGESLSHGGWWTWLSRGCTMCGTVLCVIRGQVAGRPGTSRLVFVCDGVFSTDTIPLQVRTSVASVVFSKPPTSLPFQSGEPFPCVCGVRCDSSLVPQPHPPPTHTMHRFYPPSHEPHCLAVAVGTTFALSCALQTVRRVEWSVVFGCVLCGVMWCGQRVCSLAPSPSL